jgi:hypothetical protein
MTLKHAATLGNIDIRNQSVYMCARGLGLELTSLPDGHVHVAFDVAMHLYGSMFNVDHDKVDDRLV